MKNLPDFGAQAWSGTMPIGLGCMALTGIYGHVDPAMATATIHAALDAGVEHFDTAELYGPFRNEEILASALGGRSAHVTIATKFGYRLEGGEITGLDSSRGAMFAAVEGSLRRLKRETIDLLYQHRPDPRVPVEDVVGAMSDLVKSGKVRRLGLSATDAPTLRRAHAVHAISAVQNEYSLLERVAELELLDEAERLGAVFVAYSPLGRGRLAGPAKAAAERLDDDYRRNDPRFTPDALNATGSVVEVLTAIAAERAVAPAAIALSWLLTQRPHLRAIPGARHPSQVRDFASAQDLRLSADDLERLRRVTSNCVPEITPNLVPSSRGRSDGQRFAADHPEELTPSGCRASER